MDMFALITLSYWLRADEEALRELQGACRLWGTRKSLVELRFTGVE